MGDDPTARRRATSARRDGQVHWVRHTDAELPQDTPAVMPEAAAGPRGENGGGIRRERHLLRARQREHRRVDAKEAAAMDAAIDRRAAHAAGDELPAGHAAALR